MASNFCTLNYDEYRQPEYPELSQDQKVEILKEKPLKELFELLDADNKKHYLGEVFELISLSDENWLRAEFEREIINNGVEL